ncbi:hypothetical protein [Bradyrhizobium sp. USDA 10063]
MNRPLQWFDDTTDHPPWIKALEGVRRRATREGYCYHHVQAIIVAIDQYAEAALGNREILLEPTIPHRIWWRRPLATDHGVRLAIGEARQGKGEPRKKPNADASTALKTPLQQPQIRPMTSRHVAFIMIRKTPIRDGGCVIKLNTTGDENDPATKP